MKRKDIELGKVYGYSEQSGMRRIYRYDAVMVLSADLFMIDRYKRTIGPADEYHTTMTSGRASYGNAVGLLCVDLRSTDPGDVAKVRKLATVEGALEGINGAGRAIHDPDDAECALGQYFLLTNQRHLHGDYYELVAELEASERQSKRAAQQHEEARLAAVERHNALAVRLDALGITGYHVMAYESPSRFEKLRFEDMDELITLAEQGYHV
jgi:hypothetical protein